MGREQDVIHFGQFQGGSCLSVVGNLSATQSNRKLGFVIEDIERDASQNAFTHRREQTGRRAQLSAGYVHEQRAALKLSEARRVEVTAVRRVEIHGRYDDVGLGQRNIGRLIFNSFKPRIQIDS